MNLYRSLPGNSNVIKLCNLRVCSWIVAWNSVLWAYPAFAQRSDVPQFDSGGNFRSTRIQGNRGVYQQRSWLVIDKDPGGLNCRPFNLADKPKVSLSYGTIVKTKIDAPDDDAILIRDGKTWLRVTVTDGVEFDYRRTGRGEPYTCMIRANNTLIAPINNDDLEGLK